MDVGYFKTYVSTSWIKQIAEEFVRDEGMLFEIQPKFREHAICCDVSWISKFGFSECEILIARSIDAVRNRFRCEVPNKSDGRQTVSLDYYEGFKNVFASRISEIRLLPTDVEEHEVIKDSFAKPPCEPLSPDTASDEEDEKDEDEDPLSLKSGGEQPQQFEISRKCASLSQFVVAILEGGTQCAQMSLYHVVC